MHLRRALMTSTEESRRAKKSVSMSMMIGMLLVPLGAYAASALVQTTGVPESTSAPDVPPAAEPALTEPVSIGADLETACGEAGLAMIAAETAGSMSSLQQAALDALRGVCAEQGMPLPAPGTTQTAVTTVTQPAPPPPSAPVSAEVVSASDDDDHDDDHGRHGGDDDEDGHGRHGGDDEDDHHGGDHD